MRNSKGQFVKGSSGFNGKHSLSSRQKMSKSHIGYVMPESQRKNLSKSLKGIVFTEERKRNISNALMGKVVSNEIRIKISKTLTGRKNSKHSEFMKGKRYAFVKDKSKLKKGDGVSRFSTIYYEWLIKVRKRDKFRCKINNKDCSGNIEVHHILPWRDYPELRYDVNNGITLCKKHHPRKRKEEIRLSPYFTELLKINK